MDIVVKGRKVEVPEHFRVHVTDKLSRVERLDSKVIRLDVEIAHERNPRQSSSCQRVEITCITKGPKVRAEASSSDFYAALDIALDRLESRLRRAADRRRVHRGHATPTSVAAATASLPPVDATSGVALLTSPDDPGAAPQGAAAFDVGALDGAAASSDGEAAPDGTEHRMLDGGLVVREKTHSAEPMTLDQALHEMELVGHDFYLFADSETGMPCVVYRRRGYDYGVIRLAS